MVVRRPRVEEQRAKAAAGAGTTREVQDEVVGPVCRERQVEILDAEPDLVAPDRGAGELGSQGGGDLAVASPKDHRDDGTRCAGHEIA